MKINSTILILLLHTSVFGQGLLNDVTVCNDSSNRLHFVSVGNYDTFISYGHIDSIRSKDGLLCYDNQKLLFKLKNLYAANDDNRLILQLTKKGVLIRNKDTAMLVNTPQSVSALNQDAVSIYRLDHFDFFLQFENGYIKRIEFFIGGLYYSVKLHPTKYYLSWDINSVAKNKETELIFTYEDDKPYLFETRDNNKKLGILLLTKKGRTTFQSLNIFRIKSKKQISIDEAYTINYDKKGKDLSKRAIYCRGN